MNKAAATGETRARSASVSSSQLRESLQALEQALRQVIRGKGEPVRLALVALLAEGHLLIEDVPGVGKTTLAHALARSIDCQFQRVQFTSDLLPSRRYRWASPPTPSRCPPHPRRTG